MDETVLIVEQRSYTTQPGRVGDYLKLYEAEGLPRQLHILGRLVGYYRTEIGELNQVIHLWAYADLDERRERRARLLQDPQFKAYVQKMLPLLVRQETKILTPAPFFQPRWQDGATTGT
jgi:hypothetical protein